MQTIEVSFDTWQHLTALRHNEQDSYDAVLRRQLKLPDKANGTHSDRPIPKYACRGGAISVGTKLRKRYKGNLYEAEVTERGIKYSGKYYSTPSEAAVAVTHQNTNGWLFWNALPPGQARWKNLSSLR